ncbi:segregation and condensation protein A [Streptomyces mirabilis]|uniref:segregation and condensation protein A n=1 Tax=Streptomyces mirabilis TaxID=68239 RepID=UPI0036BBD9C6
MTSNDTSVPAGSGGRRRVLGRGPGATPVPTEERDGRPEEPAEERVEPAEEPTVDGRAESVEEPVEEPVEAAAETAPELPADTAPEPPAGDSPADTALESSTAGPPADTALEPSAGPPAQAEAGDGVFKVRLANFEGPFDLLLQLISKHKLDVTEVALSKVTDEFMAHIRAMGPDWDLDQTTEFLVVAATLLDLKAARLLPAAEVEDEADLALLEARDLLFARLLQYRAYKQIADIFNARLEEEGRRYPRTVGLEAHHAELLPEVVISIGAEGFARLAVKAMQPKPKPQVYVDHIHAPLVSVQEQAGIVVARLRELGEASFRALVEDTQDTLTVVARFLALLELYREKAVALDQEEALGELMVRWTGGDGDGQPRVTDEFDRPPEVAKDDRAKDGDTKDDKIKDGAKEEKA